MEIVTVCDGVASELYNCTKFKTDDSSQSVGICSSHLE